VKKIIERLEEVESFLFERYRFGLSEGVDNKPLKKRIDMLKDAIAELKAPPIRKGEGERRVRCNWCGSVFDEEHIKVRDDIEYCPVCGDSGYLMDLSEEESKPRWETPDQWKKRTGEAWPEDWPVWDITDGMIGISTMAEEEERKTWGNHIYVIATEAGKPPDDWRPGEDKP
jgi:hypothetical protein